MTKTPIDFKRLNLTAKEAAEAIGRLSTAMKKANTRWLIKEPLCLWTFKGPECGYRGPADVCRKTIEHCKSYGNESRFGGFPSMDKYQDFDNNSEIAIKTTATDKEFKEAMEKLNTFPKSRAKPQEPLPDITERPRRKFKLEE